MPKPKLLFVGDSPTVHTGFANVTRNLCKRWLDAFDIDIWGINYSGWPHEYPYRIFPAGFSDWNSDQKLMQLLNLLGVADYTHLFILCDSHMLSHGQVPKFFRQMCDEKKIQLTHYYPVDAPLDAAWLHLAEAADNAVTYTNYGREQTQKHLKNCPVHVIPHGVDTSVYYPREDRETLRETAYKGWVKPDDFLLLNVNRNERRKAPHHSIAILKALRKLNVPAKLVLHMPRKSPDDGTDLEVIGEQLGMPHGVHWKHNDPAFKNSNGMLTEDGMNAMYNTADMVISTSLGEGWGLSLSEGLAAGCRIAAPDHTSCQEILSKVQSLQGRISENLEWLPLSPIPMVNLWDSSRVRYPVDTTQAAEDIAFNYDTTMGTARFPMCDAVKEWLSWDRIAGEFLKLMLP